MQPFSQASAETLALKALDWLIADEDLTRVFLGSTGSGVEDIRARAEDTEFLASVLDFILMDDAWVIGLAHALRESPDAIMAARAALPGGQGMHWT